MNNLIKTDDVMQELWAIKEQTAKTFQTVAAYCEHLRTTAAVTPVSQLPAKAPARKRGGSSKAVRVG
jgi:hypothetical protein